MGSEMCIRDSIRAYLGLLQIDDTDIIRGVIKSFVNKKIGESPIYEPTSAYMWPTVQEA